MAGRTDIGKCTHLYDETQGTMKHKRFRQKIVFVRCKKIDNDKRRRKQRIKTDKEVGGRHLHCFPFLSLTCITWSVSMLIQSPNCAPPPPHTHTYTTTSIRIPHSVQGLIYPSYVHGLIHSLFHTGSNSFPLPCRVYLTPSSTQGLTHPSSIQGLIHSLFHTGSNSPLFHIWSNSFPLPYRV